MNLRPKDVGKLSRSRDRKDEQLRGLSLIFVTRASDAATQRPVAKRLALLPDRFGFLWRVQVRR